MNWPPPNLVDLHRHHDTSHTPESISRVSRLLHIPAFEGLTIEQIRKQVQAPPGSDWNQWYSYLKEVRKAYVSTTAVAELTRDVLQDAAKEGLRVLELRVSLLSTVDTIRTYNPSEAQAEFWSVARRTLEALLEIRRQESSTGSMAVDFILSISCQNKYLSYVGPYIDLMKDYASEILAVDLTNETDNKPTTYKTHLERIRPHIKFLTIHCMETTGPERGWDALKLEPDRLGHGINAIRDPKLVEELRNRRVPLEICPLSNLLTGVAGVNNHPFRQLDEAGLILTINHDGLNNQTSLKDDYAFVQNTLDYSDSDLGRFVNNGWEHAFRNMKQKNN